MALKFLNRFKSWLNSGSSASLQQAEALQREGKWAEAEEAYGALLEAEPGNAEAKHALAGLLSLRNDHAGAIALYDEVLRQKNQFSEGYFKRANALNALGRWQEALQDYDRAVELRPDYAKAYCNRGTALQNLQQSDAAMASYDRATALDPEDFRAIYNRANLLAMLGRLAEALTDYDRALQINPDFTDAYNNRGNVLSKLGRHTDALASFDRAVGLSPVNAEAFHGRGLAYFELRDFDRALTDFDRAVALSPRYANAFVNRGNALHEMRRSGEAIASYDQAIALNPQIVEAFKGRGVTLLAAKQFDAAIESFGRALALNPGERNLLGIRRYAQMQICDWQGFESDCESLRAGIAAGGQPSPPFPMLALLDAPYLHRLTAERWVETECPPDALLGRIELRDSGKKIRVGYFSADFREHPVSFLTAGLFEAHDRTRFEVFGFSYGVPTDDPMRRRLQRGFDRFIDIGGLSDAKAAQCARGLMLDIAVDLGGFTENSRTRIFSLRAAPVQLSYIGYLGTMGAPYMDYLIADRSIVPPSQREFYAERLLYLPSYQVNDSKRPVAVNTYSREQLGLPAQGFVFSCFNSNYKITPPVFSSWMRILKRVEGSVLFLLAESPRVAANLKAAAGAAKVDPARLCFGNRVGMESYLNRFCSMDLFLDTWPYNAGTTASDALWAGLPVLTFAGHAFAARVGASLLTALGLSELITDSPSEYEDLAVQLANDPKRLARVRSQLMTARESSPLFDTATFTRKLEIAFGQIHERASSGQAPCDIDVV